MSNQYTIKTISSVPDNNSCHLLLLFFVSLFSITALGQGTNWGNTTVEADTSNGNLYQQLNSQTSACPAGLTDVAYANSDNNNSAQTETMANKTLANGAYYIKLASPIIADCVPIVACTNYLQLKIKGTGFTGATSVQINGVSAWSFTVDSSKQITATFTNGATSGSTLTVTTAGGTGTMTIFFAVNPAFTSGEIANTGETICYNGNPGPIGSTIAASGGDGTITYQWKANGVDLPGSNAATYDPPEGLTVTKTYTRWAQTNICNTTPTQAVNSWTVTVRPQFTSGAINWGGESICTGGNPALIGSTTPASGGDNSITYQWQANGIDIPGSDSATYDPPSGLTVTTTYTRYAKDGTCNSYTLSTGSWTVSVNSIYSITTQPMPLQTVCSGSSVSFSVIVSGTGLTYQWYKGGTLLTDNGVSIWGTKTAILFIDPVGTGDAASDYYCVAGGACSSSVISDNAALVVYQKPVIDAYTLSICSGESFTVGPVNGLPTAATIVPAGTTYSWSAPTVTGGITGGTAKSGETSISDTLVNPTSTVQTATYLVTPTSDTAEVCTGNPFTVSVTVNPLPAPTVGMITQPVCTLASGSVVLSGLPLGSWTITQTGTTGNTITGSSASSTISGLAAGTYNFTVSNATCTSLATANVVINPLATKTWSSGWSPSVPVSNDNIVFAGDFSSTSDITGCSCQVISGNVVIKSGHTLIITNGVTVSGGTLTFEDTACLVQINDASVNSGNVTYKRKTTALKPYDYTYWSSPVAGATLSQLATNSLFYSWNPSIPTWEGQTDIATMAPGVGYIGRTGATASPGLTTSFVGTPNNGSISPTIVKGAPGDGEANLIGNPYASALDANKFIQDSRNKAIDGTIYLWTHYTAISNNVYTGSDYAMYNLVGGTKAADSGGGVVPSGKIAAGQGFFVVATANGTVTFDNSMRVPGNNTQFFKMTPNMSTVSEGLEKHRLWLSISDTNGGYNQMLVGYIEGATNEVDRLYDGRPMSGGNSVSLYTLIGTTELSIQGRALPFSNEDLVPLGYSTTINGPLTIKLDEFDGVFAAYQEVYLHDKLTNVYQDLKAGDYTFAATSGTHNDRFELRFNQTLGIGNPIRSENGVKIISSDHELSVINDSELISKVQVYDVLGKLLFVQNNLNTYLFKTDALSFSPQVLIVKVTLDNDEVFTKKIVIQ